MPERSAISQRVQVGLETTEGSIVAANRNLQALGIALVPQIETHRFRPTGTKLDTLVTPGKDWTEGTLTGVATYDELIYPLASVLVNPGTPTTSGTTGKLWTFAPSIATEDAVATFTVEQGSGVRAQRATGGVVTDFGLKWDRSGVTLSGKLMAQLFTDNITMTASPTSVPLVPILPNQLSVYADPTGTALGTTKLLRVLSGDIAIGKRFAPLWTINAAIPSYAARVEDAPDVTMKLLMEADAAGMGYLANARAGSSVFIRVEAIGAQIGAGPAVYRLSWDMALKVEKVDSLADSNGVYAVGYTFRGIYDATWAQYISVALLNATAAF